MPHSKFTSMPVHMIWLYCFLGLRCKKRGLDGVGNTLLTVITNKAPAVLIKTEHFQPQHLKELMNAPVMKSLPSCYNVISIWP